MKAVYQPWILKMQHYNPRILNWNFPCVGCWNSRVLIINSVSHWSLLPGLYYTHDNSILLYLL